MCWHDVYTHCEEICQFTKILQNYNECFLKLYCIYILYFIFVFCMCLHVCLHSMWNKSVNSRKFYSIAMNVSKVLLNLYFVFLFYNCVLCVLNSLNVSFMLLSKCIYTWFFKVLCVYVCDFLMCRRCSYRFCVACVQMFLTFS